jgi:sodium/potassium/calcium exchanger 6
MAGSKTIVRLTSGCVAVLVIVLYAGTVNRKDHLSLREADAIPVHHRKLLGIIEDPYEDSIPSECKGSGGTPDQDNANCTQPLLHGNESCSFITDNCQDDVQLVDYLGFVACDLPNVKPLGFVILAFWLLYLISLLATTADYFFVPPLYLISDKLKLSPSIAGITFLAIGNGAPDVFTAFSALKNGDLPLVLGALIGASIFISTVVLGSVILITKVTSETIGR